MTDTAQVARVVSEYMHRYPGESLMLAPLWQTLAQHRTAGGCLHGGICTLVKVSPVVVDERRHVLVIRTAGGRLRLPEVGISSCETLYGGAETLARALGVWRPWVYPGCEDPVHLEPACADSEDGSRTRVAVRYLLHTQSEYCQWAPGAPQAWASLTMLGNDLNQRLSALLAKSVL